MSMFSTASSNVTPGRAIVIWNGIQVHRHQVDRHDAVLVQRRHVLGQVAPGRAARRGWRDAASSPGRRAARESRSPRRPSVTATPAVAERRGGAAGGDDLPAELGEALGEGDDPALVADRDQRARHDGRSRSGLHGFGKRDGAAGRARPPARPRAAAGARPRARAPRGARGVSPGRTGTRPWARIAPAVVHLVHQVDRGAALARAARQHRLVHAAAVHARGPPKAGQQGGVDVQDAIAVAGDDGGGHQLEVAGQHQQVDPVARPGARASRRRRPGRAAPRPARRARAARSSAAASARLLSDQHHPRRGLRRPGHAAAPRGCCRAPRRPRPRASSWPGKLILGRAQGNAERRSRESTLTRGAPSRSPSMLAERAVRGQSVAGYGVEARIGGRRRQVGRVGHAGPRTRPPRSRPR